MKMRALSEVRAQPVVAIEDDVRIIDESAGSLPVLIESRRSNLRLADWFVANESRIERLLRTIGGVLFRGFEFKPLLTFEQFVDVAIRDRIKYQNRSTPRTELRNRIYTSTEYPSDQKIAMHNEFSYDIAWPQKICFGAIEVPASGGETLIADSRAVYQRIPEKVREEFSHRKVLYVRTYGTGIDIPWQEVFQTDNRAEVERYCREHQIKMEWWGSDGLRTYQIGPGVARHPMTGEMVWFNQAHLFHSSNLQEEVRQSIAELFEPDRQPRDARYCDGTSIPLDHLATVRATFDELTIPVKWQPGDILLLDNMLIAHGRASYTGRRQVVVAMGDPISAGGNATDQEVN